MQILHVAGYKFIPLNHLEELKQNYLAKCKALSLKGTILLSNEGINLNLAGFKEQINTFITFLKTDTRFTDISFHQSYVNIEPYRFLKIKIKKEIITFRKSHVDPTHTRAPLISPALLKQWLDENRDITLLDTRNTYEVQFGTFNKATHLNLTDFCEFAEASTQINIDKPIVMFCTGGIRCEKAALYLLSKGIKEVYQLDGGILGYFAKEGGKHYQGECFVFDERISVDCHLNQTDTVQCKQCQKPISKVVQAESSYVPNISCPACIKK